MGKSLREVAKQDTPLGKEIYQIQNVTKYFGAEPNFAGSLASQTKFFPREQGIFFEGVPRTEDQQGYLEEEIDRFRPKIDAVILSTFLKKKL